jgi:hypothetical protein
MKSKREFDMSHKLFPKSAVLLLICCGQGLSLMLKLPQLRRMNDLVPNDFKI